MCAMVCAPGHGTSSGRAGAADCPRHAGMLKYKVVRPGCLASSEAIVQFPVVLPQVMKNYHW